MVRIRITPILLSTIFLSTAFLSTGGAMGQNTISLASNLSHQGRTAPNSCQEQAAVLARSLNNFPRPDKWHWVIVCDDAGWRQFLMQRDPINRESGNETIYGSTDLSGHLTCLRGTTLLKPDNAAAKADHVIAHELAHIMLNTRDEERSEQQAVVWLTQREEGPGLVGKSR